MNVYLAVPIASNAPEARPHVQLVGKIGPFRQTIRAVVAMAFTMTLKMRIVMRVTAIVLLARVQVLVKHVPKAL